MTQRDRSSGTGIDPAAYSVAGFEDFRRRAADPRLSPHEKSGFPDLYREGRGGTILNDILAKMPPLCERGRRVLDIGPGSSSLPMAVIEHCIRQQHSLVMVDSAEMLALLPDHAAITKIAGAFPAALPAVQKSGAGFDAILVYSVAQYVFAEGNLWSFVDLAAGLLNPGGTLLIGDLPNASMRKRFLASAAGREHHRRHVDPNNDPVVDFNLAEPGQINDAVVFAILQRMRLAGFDAFVLPQAPELPQASRREDILIRRP
ncbi:SAM-dependent methyltransferase [Ferrovibrio terrae]|uniref:SAM-dependent methyltransferase n=1 Tax=Ferrovibrio terrae TaxID=2594003 RepID=A0A516GWX3_9PROT|nr:SAM-dependent methyltransferase [Ferrovibrio terrae]QDO96036.1 SAM-dependent methyltransferase [Ferrovibrio terrae]